MGFKWDILIIMIEKQAKIFVLSSIIFLSLLLYSLKIVNNQYSLVGHDEQGCLIDPVLTLMKPVTFYLENHSI